MNYFNDNTEKSTPPGFSMNQFTNPFSFSDRLASPPVDPGDEVCRSSSFSGRVSEENGSGQPNFRSVQPVPLPIYPSSFAAELRDSPFLLNISNILPSPTTGAFQFHNFNSNSYSICNSEGKDNTSAWSLQESSELQDAAKSEYISSQITSHETATAQAKSDCETERKVNFQSNCENYQNQTQLYRREDRKSDDGYNWRKYGQKQMKGSQNPRSYFKCTYPNCPTTKKVEQSLDGQITEIVYRGKHSHPMPQSTRRLSSSCSSGSAVTSSASQVSNPRSAKTRDQSSVVQDIGRVDSVATSVNSSVSVDNGNFDESSRIRKGRLGDVHEFDEKEPDAKRWKEESGNQEIPGLEGRTVREPRVVVRTTSDIDVLDDGYRWRKYGQKVVKGNPNPRNYYKCTHPGCGVRKHVERAADDLRAVITTYEGKHKHAVPLTRRSHNHTVGRPFPRNDNVKMHPFPESEAPFSLEIVPRNLGFLGSENSVGSFMTQAHNSNDGVSATNESKNSSLLFLESLLD